MPTKPPVWCPRCRVAHSNKCPQKKAWSSGKRSGKGRGGRPWRRIRKTIFERDNYLCQEHYRSGRLVPVELHGDNAGHCDHIVSKQDGGTDNESNLETLCQQCHKAKTQAESVRGRGV